MRLILIILWFIHFLPTGVLGRLGNIFGLVLMLLGNERRKVVTTNINLCFPNKPLRWQINLRRKHYSSLGRAILDTTILWWSDPSRIKKMVKIEGWNNFQKANEKAPVIVLAPHFVGAEILGIRISMEQDAISIYSKQKNAYINKFLKNKRERFSSSILISRQKGIKPAIKYLAKNMPLYILPDMDFGPKNALFIPFFGVPAATVDTVSRIARIRKAIIVPVVIKQKSIREGYTISFLPEWENYPTKSSENDTIKMNTFFEQQIRDLPEQYYWVHKRFKSRPPGEKPFY